jgi:speckle-type POZ protein
MVNTPEVALKHSSRGGSHIPRKSYCRFEFQVCDWSLMKSSTGAQIVSQEFVMSDSSKWVLRIFPGGATPRQSGFVSVQMVLIELGNDEDCTTAYFTISIVGRKIMQEHLKMFTPLDNIFSLKSPSIMEFRLGDEAHSSWAVDNFILNSELEEKYMENDAVLFALEIEVLGKAELLSSTMPDSLGPMPSLSDDFGALLKSQEDTDITLVAGHKKIRCHRIVLAARSNYFKKKFQGTTFHTRLIFQGGQYYMQDISEEVLSEIVHFIYTDNYRYDTVVH